MARNLLLHDGMNHKNKETEQRIDDALAESFPSSDPPAWGAIAERDKEITENKNQTASLLAVLGVGFLVGYKAAGKRH